MMRSKVVLPQPDGPSDGADLALLQTESDLAQDRSGSGPSREKRLGRDRDVKHASAASATHAARSAVR